MNKRDAADRATVETALEETVGNAPAPDLCQRILLAAESSPSPTPRRHRFTAAIVLLAASIVIAVIVFDRDQPPIQPETGKAVHDPDVHDPDVHYPEVQDPEQDPQTDAKIFHPKSLHDAQRWLEDVEEITLRIDSIWAPLSARRVKLPVAILFDTNQTTISHEDEVYRLSNSIRAAMDPKLDSIAFNNDMQAYFFELRCEKKGRSMIIQLQYRAASGVFELRSNAAHTGLVSPDSDQVRALKRYLDRRILTAENKWGVATSDDDLDRLPSDQTTIGAYDLSWRGILKLARFEKLVSLDLRGSPTALSQPAFSGENVPLLASVKKLQLGFDACRKAQIEFCRQLTPNIEEFELSTLWQRTLDAALLPRELIPSPDQLHFDDDAMQMLAGFKNLESIHLFGSKVTDSGIEALAELPRLNDLFIHSTSVSGTGFRTFTSQQHLKTVRLIDSRLSIEGLQAIAALRLDRLNLIWVQGQIRALARLSDSSSLSRITLFDPRLEGDEADWREVFTAWSKIETLRKFGILSSTFPIRALEAFDPPPPGFDRVTLMMVSQRSRELVEAVRKKVSFEINIDN